MADMKLSITAEYHGDEAARKLAKFHKQQEKLNRSQKAAAKSVDSVKSAYRGMQNTSKRAWDVATKGANKATEAAKKYYRQLKLNAKVGFGHIKKGAGKVARGAALGTALFTSIYGGAAGAAGLMTNTAAEFEKFQTILQTTEGSTAGAKKAMGWVQNFAVKTPYELAQVTDGFVKLRSYGLDPTQGLMQALGDTSAAMGKPLIQSVEAIADAVTGENERLKEFGITASKSGNKITYEYSNAAGQMERATVKASDRMAIQMKLMEIMNSKYAGSMDRLSQTWDGMVRNLSDQWTKFQMMIMNAGLFIWMKGKLGGLLDKINEMEANGSLEKLAGQISTWLQEKLAALWDFGVGVVSVLSTVSEYLSIAASYVGGFENLFLILAGLAFAPALIATATGILQIANGLRLLLVAVSGLSALSALGPLLAGVTTAIAAMGAALLANPITWIIAGIAAAAYLIYRNWGAVKSFFVSLWAGVKSAFSATWEFLKSALQWHPAAMIYNNWSSIKSAVGDALTSAYTAAQAGWENIKTTVSGAVKGVVESVRANWDMLKTIFEWSPIGLVMKAFSGIGDAVGGLVDGAAQKASNAWQGIKNMFGGQQQEPIQMALSQPQSIDRAVAATDKLKTGLAAVDQLLNALNAKLAGMSFHKHGVGLMNTLAAGIRAGKNTVVNAVRDVAQSMRDHLPSSPAKTGPLSDIHRLKFAETIASSIHAGPMVRAMRLATAATLAAASPAMADSGNTGYGGTIPSPSMAVPDIASPQSVRIAQPSERAMSVAGSNGATSGGLTINYAPQISVGAGASVSEEDIRSLLDEDKDRLLDMLEERLAERERLNF